jgi:hypothetical protein
MKNMKLMKLLNLDTHLKIFLKYINQSNIKLS